MIQRVSDLFFFLLAGGANGAGDGWPLRLVLITDASHSDVQCLPLSPIVVLITGLLFVIVATAAAASASGL